MLHTTALDGLLEVCDLLREPPEGDHPAAETLERVDSLGRALSPMLPGLGAAPEAAELGPRELFVVTLLIHHRMRADSEPLDGAALIRLLSRAGLPRSAAMALLAPAHQLRQAEWLDSTLPDGGFDPLDATFSPSALSLRVFWPGAQEPEKGAKIADEESAREAEAQDPYRDEAEYLWELHSWRGMCIQRADSVFEVEVATGRPSPRNRMLRRQARQRWLRIRRRVAATESGREFGMEAFMREHGLAVDHVLLLVHLIFGELIEGEPAIPLVEGLRLLSETRDDLFLKRRILASDARLRRLGIVVAESEDYAKMSCAPLALADWAVDRILAGVRRRPRWDESEFENFLNGDT
jgi:hypothetical protein